MKKALLLLLSVSIIQFCSAQISLDSTVLEIRDVATNLDVPWDMTYSADGWIWFTELSGKISRLNPDTDELEVIYMVGDVTVFGFSAGMHAIVLHPDFEQTPHVFLHYTNTESTSKIVRYTFDSVNKTLIDSMDILVNIPGGPSHNGSRMIIDDNKLFIALGDSYVAPESALDLSLLSGKFLRMNLDGSIPDDNPIVDSRVWSWGHRNPQGFCKGNGKFYSSEHGTFANDELNIIQENRNYGWPEVEGVCDLSTEIDYCNTENVAEPIWTWTPSLAPCGLEFYDNPAIPEWQNSLLLAVLKDRQLIQLKLNDAGDEVIEQNIFLNNSYGRLRDVLTIPDGRIFICTTNRDFAGSPSADDDKIIEIKPVVTVNNTQVENSNNITLYPNPTHHQMTLQSNSNLEGQLVVFDLTGKVIFNKTIESTNNYILKLEDMKPGLYYLTLTSPSNRYIKNFVIK